MLLAGYLYVIKQGWLAIFICSLSGMVLNIKEIDSYFSALWKEHLLFLVLMAITVYLVSENQTLEHSAKVMIGFSSVGILGATLMECRYRHYTKTMANQALHQSP